MKYLKKDCHPDPEVRNQIQRRFSRILDKLEEHGPAMVGDGVGKFVGNVWEIRVNHPTGAHRMFFGTGPDGLIAVACGAVKKRGAFPPTAKRVFVQRVQDYLRYLEDLENS